MPAKEVDEVDWNNQDPTTVIYKIGIYGWRKRCIYFLILLVMILTIINLSLVIWIMRVMDFNFDGMGNLRITDQGLKLYGDAEFVEELHAKLIRSRQNSELLLQSTANVTVNARSTEGEITGQLFVGNDEVVARNKKFSIVTHTGKTILYADKDNISFVADKLHFRSPGGAQFSGSVETEEVRSPPWKDLKLASLTRSLYMDAPDGITFHSKAGSMDMTSLKDVLIKSIDGKVLLDAERISFKNLKEGAQAGGSSSVDANVREVCSCKDGTLFLAPAESMCRVSQICST